MDILKLLIHANEFKMNGVSLGHVLSINYQHTSSYDGWKNALGK